MLRAASWICATLAVTCLTVSLPGVHVPLASAGETKTKPGEKIHVVAKGDSLIAIGKRYGVSVDALRARNGLKKGGRKIQPGDELVIPKPAKDQPQAPDEPSGGAKAGEQIHEVQKGQTLSGIAKRYGVTVSALRERNGLVKGGRPIRPGQELVIPKPEPEPDPVTPIVKPKGGGVAGCPGDMVNVGGAYCMDRYEGYIAFMLAGGKLKRHSPFEPLPAKAKNIKALNRRGRVPQGYISQQEAALACQNAGKRLCTDDEWVAACKGKRPTTWPYGKEQKPGKCNDSGVSSFNHYYGSDGEPAPKSAYTWEHLNDPRLNQLAGTCAPSGKFAGCRNSYKLYDMVGNLHEWTAAPSGTFRGGYYLDVTENGDGCDYKTTAHNTKYHDYSTGFRCCKG